MQCRPRLVQDQNLLLPYTDVFICIPVYVCAEARGGYCLSSLLTLHLMFLRQGLIEPGACLFVHTVWPASPRDSSCLCLPSAEIVNMCPWPFIHSFIHSVFFLCEWWGLSQVLMAVWSTFYLLSQLPSPYQNVFVVMDRTTAS